MNNDDRLSELRRLCIDLKESESELQIISVPLKNEIESIRNRISFIVAQFEECKASIPGFGSAYITSPKVGHKYDTDKIDELIESLHARRDNGSIDIEWVLKWLSESVKVTSSGGGLTVRQSRKRS